jgi:hypothetical protein
MRIALVYIQVRCEQPEGPEGNVSRYTVRPGTLGLTLDIRSTLPRKPRGVPLHNAPSTRHLSGILEYTTCASFCEKIVAKPEILPRRLPNL